MNRQQLDNIRACWLEKNLDEETRTICQRHNIAIPKTEKQESSEVWGDWKWHISARVHDLMSFLLLFPQYQGQEHELSEWLKSYDLSILPLNLLQPEGVQKFLPRPGLVPAPDPYGVQQEHSIVLREEDGKKFYLATRKPGYATFLPILSGGASRVFCPIGCAGCYRGAQTRFNEPLRIIKKDGTTEDIQIPQPVEQIRWLVERWNLDPQFSEVYDILISGGEPMILPNSVWKQMLDELKNAKYLKSLRICTGALFLGLPFRFDDEFIGILTDFRKTTGVSIKMSTHISHPENITPEAIFFARKILRAGIEILPQIPLEGGVNFWMDDLQRTARTLRQLDRLLALAVGTRAYKWIVDMQKRRVNQGVSIISAIEVWRILHDGHCGESDITRPTSLALFFPHERGNLNLSFHSLWAIKKQVDQKRAVVRYKIPHPAGGWLDYEEPLWPGANA